MEVVVAVVLYWPENPLCFRDLFVFFCFPLTSKAERVFFRQEESCPYIEVVLRCWTDARLCFGDLILLFCFAVSLKTECFFSQEKPCPYMAVV